MLVFQSSPPNPGCRIISLAHLRSFLLSSSCLRKMSRLSAAVNLLILNRKEPVRGERFSPLNGGLEGSFASQFFSAQHPSNVTQIPPTEEWLLHPQDASGTLVVFSALYAMCCIQALQRNSRGTLAVTPGRVFKNPGSSPRSKRVAKPCLLCSGRL